MRIEACLKPEPLALFSKKLDSNQIQGPLFKRYDWICKNPVMAFGNIFPRSNMLSVNLF